MDKKALRNLYTTDKHFKKLFDWLAQYCNNNPPSTMVKVVSDELSVSYLKATALVQQLVDMGCGEYRKGRSGKNQVTYSRIEWSVPPMDVVAAARGLDELLPAPEKTISTKATIVAAPRQSQLPAGSQDDDSLTLHFPLRKDCFVQFTVPADITSTEAHRLASFICSVPFDQSEAA